MERYLKARIKKDMDKKIILISGPRQSGKTTLSKMLSASYDYLNYDYDGDRNTMDRKEWDRKKDLIILDELHKKPKWKSWLKGVYDVEGLKPNLVVTGSAKLNTYRKVGDSLAGRYFSFRLHPLDLKEIFQFDKKTNIDKSFKQILQFGGFPEPYFQGSEEFYKRWRKTHVDIILKQDLVTLEKVTNIIGIENLIRLLRHRVGSTISYANLAKDLEVDPKTVKHWLEILENLYVIFKVTPYSKKMRNTILKAPKYYFYDNGQVEGDMGVKLENMVACALYKELHYLEDCYGDDIALHFLRTKRGEEIDFLVVINNKPVRLIEVKWSDHHWSKSFSRFEELFTNVSKIQIVGEIQKEKTFSHLSEVRMAAPWLANLKLKD
jgi:hypothetical protein